MDIQSAALNELFVLYPVHVSGLRPVKPVGIADGGIPQALYNDKQSLVCVVDPWTELQLSNWTMAVNDRVDLYVNDNPSPATGKTVAKGEEKERIPLSLPYGWLDHGVNVVYYQVSRAGGNVEKSRDLRVLYHSSTPESLDLVIPPDVIKDGVGPEQAERGVEFGFTYTNRRNHDRIEFLLGDTKISFDVPDAPTPITQKLFTVEFQKAGDNPSAVAEFRVYDQLGNLSQSSRKRLGIHLNRLMVPTLTKVMDASNTEIPQAGTTTSTTLNLAGKASNAQTVEIFDGSGPSAVSKGTAVADATTGDWTHTITVAPGAHRLYAQSRYHSTPVYSNVRTLTVVELAVPTISSVKGSTSGVEIPHGTHTVETSVVLTGTASKGQKVEVFDGTDSKGQPVADLTTGIWTLPVSSLVVALHSFTAKAFGGSGQPSAARTLTVVAVMVPTLTKVMDASNIDIPEAGTTTSTTLNLAGKASNAQTVEIFDGRGPSAVSKGTAIADATTGDWTHTITVALGAHRLYAQSRYHSTPVYSNVRNLTVVAALKLSFTNAPYTVASGGRLKAINLLLHSAADTPMPNATITLTLPAGFTYSDGGNGARDFTSGTEGVVIVSGVKGAATPGAYTLHAASSGAPEATAVLTVMERGPVGTIAGLAAPFNVAISPDGTHAYVTNRSGSVSVIETVNNSVIQTITVGQDPWGVAVHPDGSRAYVACFNDNSVWVIDTVNWGIQKIPFGHGSSGVAVHPDGSRAYVTHYNYSVSSVSVIDTATNSVIQTIQLKRSSTWVAVHPDGSRAYVTHYNGNLVTVIDTTTTPNSVIQTITVEPGSSGVAVHPDGRVYVANSAHTSVTVIDTATTPKMITVGRAPDGVAVHPDGSCVYVTNQIDNSVSVIDTATTPNTEIHTIMVGQGPSGVAVHPDGRVYVVNALDKSVSVIVSD
jgi:YVTN family beta-propeller protein